MRLSGPSPYITRTSLHWRQMRADPFADRTELLASKHRVLFYPKPTSAVLQRLNLSAPNTQLPIRTPDLSVCSIVTILSGLPRFIPQNTPSLAPLFEINRLTQPRASQHVIEVIYEYIGEQKAVFATTTRWYWRLFTELCVFLRCKVPAKRKSVCVKHGECTVECDN